MRKKAKVWSVLAGLRESERGSRQGKDSRKWLWPGSDTRSASWSGRTSLVKGGPWLLTIVLLCGLWLLSACATADEGPVAADELGASHRGLVYVAIGASDSFGFGTADPYADNWPIDLAHKLGPSVHLVNLGIPGIHLHQALNLELPIALDVHPDIVTIWLAVNDLADHVPVTAYARDLDLLLTRLQAGVPQARIAIANVPDLTLLPHFHYYDQQWLSDQIRLYNAAIAESVRKHHLILVDLSQQGYNLARHPEYVSSDGLHPSVIGYIALADLFYQALRRAGQ
ncbi:SGNH/GDSL hydrolase family protein [Thermogemmatispora sp.]|uniref:SGNH/GDSL hydrolase family protein n=1 Tax=Thermogemmatispora sp. TaxID=1968838 RepID=UPI0035E3FAAD